VHPQYWLSAQHEDPCEHSGHPLLALDPEHGCLQKLPMQWADVQSSLLMHLAFSGHGPHWPPQSMSVSVPFFVRSAQLEARHVASAQAPSAQSEPIRHRMPI
jgi:hypothetical protein